MNTTAATAALVAALVVLLASTDAAPGPSSPVTSGRASFAHFAPRALHKRGAGEATYYDPGLGACEETSSAGDLIAALNHADFDAGKTSVRALSSPMCHACLRVSDPRQPDKQPIVVRVLDRCPGCKPGDLDLSPAAFNHFNDPGVGRFNVEWQVVPCNGGGAVAPAPVARPTQQPTTPPSVTPSPQPAKPKVEPAPPAPQPKPKVQPPQPKRPQQLQPTPVATPTPSRVAPAARTEPTATDAQASLPLRIKVNTPANDVNNGDELAAEALTKPVAQEEQQQQQQHPVPTAQPQVDKQSLEQAPVQDPDVAKATEEHLGAVRQRQNIMQAMYERILEELQAQKPQH